MMQAPRHVPDELRELIEHSTAEFERTLRAELGTFALAVNVGKWVQSYREEAESLALEAYDLGRDEE
jgi:hypothetical protein